MVKYTNHTIIFNGKRVYYKPVLFRLIFLILQLNLFAFDSFAFGIFTNAFLLISCPNLAEELDTVSKNDSNSFSDDDKKRFIKICSDFYSSRIFMELDAAYSKAIYLLLINVSIILFYKINVRFAIKSLKRRSKLSYKKILQLSEKRRNYLKFNTGRNVMDSEYQILNLISKEKLVVFANLKHRNLLLKPPEFDPVFFNLKDIIFQLTWKHIPGNLPPHVNIVVYIRDILNGLQYLHDRQIYHLNLCPENIYIKPSEANDSGRVKISGLDFAIKTKQRTIDYQKVGLEWIYR